MATDKSRKERRSRREISEPSESCIFIFLINCQVKVTERSFDLRRSTTREGIAYDTKRCDMSTKTVRRASSVYVATCYHLKPYNLYVVTGTMYLQKLSFKLKFTSLYQPTHWEIVKTDWHSIASWSRNSLRYLIRFPTGHWEHDHLGMRTDFTHVAAG